MISLLCSPFNFLLDSVAKYTANSRKIYYTNSPNDIEWLRSTINSWINKDYTLQRFIKSNIEYNDDVTDWMTTYNKYMVWRHKDSRTHIFIMRPSNCWDGIKIEIDWKVKGNKVKAKFMISKHIQQDWVYSSSIFGDRLGLKLDIEYKTVLKAGESYEIKHIKYPPGYKVKLDDKEKYFRNLYNNTIDATEYNEGAGVYKLYYLYRSSYNSKNYRLIDYEETRMNRFTVKKFRVYGERVSLWIVYQSDDLQTVQMSRAIALYHFQRRQEKISIRDK